MQSRTVIGTRRVESCIGSWTRLGPIALFLLATSFVSGCATLPKPVDSGMLVFWEVRPPAENGAVAHLLGSVHIGRDDIVFDPAIQDAKAEADVLVFEVAADELDPEALEELQGTMGRLSPGESLEAMLPPATWKKLDEALASVGIPSSVVDVLEPWLAMLTVMDLQLRTAGLDREKGVERQLMADQPDRETVGLESALFQMELLAGLPRETQIAMLENTLANPGGTENVIDLTLATWEAGDLDLLAMLIAPPGRTEHQILFHERVFVERNRGMAASVQELLQTPGRYFVTVGAGHTVGETGLPTLLRDAGFHVRRIPRTPDP